MEASNVKAMCEALIKVKEWMERRIATCGFEASATFPTMLEEVVLPALSAPARNCDRFGTSEEADAAYRRFYEREIAKIPLDVVDYSRETAKIPGKDKWLFAPATGQKGESTEIRNSGDAEELRKALIAIKALTEPHADELSELGTVYRTVKAVLKGGGDAD